MTKAAVRSLDVIQELVKKNHNISVEKFMVGGASKRGWTSWTAVSVEKKASVILILTFLFDSKYKKLFRLQLITNALLVSIVFVL